MDKKLKKGTMHTAQQMTYWGLFAVKMFKNV